MDLSYINYKVLENVTAYAFLLNTINNSVNAGPYM